MTLDVFEVLAKLPSQLSVQPYHNWWFWLILLAIILTLIHGYSIYRIKSVEMTNRILEGKIADRTSKLEQIIKVLQKSQTEVNHKMHMQSRIIASISHDFRSPMNSIIYTSGEIQKMITDKQYDQATEVGIAILHTSTEIKAQLDHLLEYIKLQSDQTSIHDEPVNLRKLISLKFALFNTSDKKSPNTFINDISQEEVVNTSYELLNIVVGNLIDNANKYTYGGIVKAETQSFNKSVHLIIFNTGSGIDIQLLNWLNSDLPEMPVDTDKGIGLLIVKEVTKLLRIQIKVIPNKDGLEFHLIFPNTVV